MIEIGSLIAQSAGAMPIRRQPDSGTAVAPVQPNPQPARPPLRVVPQVVAPEELLFHAERIREEGLRDTDDAPLRSRRAISAYGEMDRQAQQDYLRSLMGIDEYV